MITLTHFSPEKLSVVDPRRFGANPWTSRAEVMAATVPRSYFYRGIRYKPEGALQARSKVLHRHIAHADVRLYDIYRDRKGIVDARRDDFDAAILEAGYGGFFTSHPSFQSKPFVAIFGALPVEYRGTWTMP